MALLKYPYTNLHELNLDWIIEQLNNTDGPVRTVNGKSGMVTLTGEDIERSTSNPETVATALQSQGTSLQTVRNQIGTTALPTTAQTLTGAIAEHETDITGIDNKIGTTVLPTTAQTLTGAAAELDGDVTTINNKIGNTALPTTAQTLTGAISEHETDITNIKNDIGFQIKQAAYNNAAEISFNIPSNSRYVFMVTSAGVNTEGCMLMVASNSSGYLSIAEVFKGSGVTVTTSTNTLTITYTTTGNRYYLYMPMTTVSNPVTPIIS